MSDQPVVETSTYTGQHNIYKHKGLTSMPSAGFEPAFPVTKIPQTYALERAATGIGVWENNRCLFCDSHETHTITLEKISSLQC
jgi:hypothetical protein